MDFLILSKRNTSGIALWWKPGRAGYTTDVNDAGRYEADEARRISKDSHGDDIAVPVSAIERTVTTRTVVDIGDANNHAELMAFCEA